MFASILSLSSSFLIPMLKWILERKAKKKLSEKEFLDAIMAHQSQRANAGQTVLDWKASLAKLKAKIAKKKE